MKTKGQTKVAAPTGVYPFVEQIYLYLVDCHVRCLLKRVCALARRCCLYLCFFFFIFAGLLETRFRFNIKMILHKQPSCRVQKKNGIYIYNKTEPMAAGFGFIRFPMLISFYGQLRFRPHATVLFIFFFDQNFFFWFVFKCVCSYIIDRRIRLVRLHAANDFVIYPQMFFKFICLGHRPSRELQQVAFYLCVSMFFFATLQNGKSFHRQRSTAGY